MSLTASDVQTEIYLIPKNAKDISGIRFGRLVAILPTRNQNGKFAWLCRCDCGKPTVVVSGNLRNGNTTSCGCFHMEQLVLQHTTHGRSRQVTYRKWATIIQRCTNPKVQNYARYGGRGIGMCDEWQQSFESFHHHVSSLPHFGEAGFTLDRIDNNGHYEPGNVRWATVIEQNRNQRKSIIVTHNGRTQHLMDWANELGIGYGTLRSRFRYGWSVERAFETPIGGKVC